MNAAEFYRTLKQHIEDAIQKHSPFRAKVTGVTNGLVQIQTYDADAPMQENYAQLAGATVSVNDEVVVLDQQAVDKWYKTEDKESFQYARRLIAEEGLLVGGSSGSAISALVQAAKDNNFGKDDVVVVVLPDSIRSYLTKVICGTPPQYLILRRCPVSYSFTLVRRRRLARCKWTSIVAIPWRPDPGAAETAR